VRIDDIIITVAQRAPERPQATHIRPRLDLAGEGDLYHIEPALAQAVTIASVAANYADRKTHLLQAHQPPTHQIGNAVGRKNMGNAQAQDNPACSQTPASALPVAATASSGSISRTRWLKGSTITGPS